MVDFVGDDPKSDKQECPAVWREPGGIFFRGKTITDPDVTARLSRDVAKGEDESDVWLPERMFPKLHHPAGDARRL